jgi:hypothetical protein
VKKKSAYTMLAARKTVKKRSPQTGLSRAMRYVLVAFGGLSAACLICLTTVSRSSPFCANSVSCIHNLTAQVENNAAGTFDGQTITPPKIDLASSGFTSTVLGAASPSAGLTGEKHIFVDLDQQKLYAFQGNTLFMDTLVSTGKWNPTPPGDYQIWIKLRSTRMSGGSGNDAYDLPNVPFVMFFANDKVSKGEGFSIHGAYWHDNFGHEMSHGCVNMRPIDAQMIYDWADPPTLSPTTYATAQNPGTTVSICQQVQLQEGSSPLCQE